MQGGVGARTKTPAKTPREKLGQHDLDMVPGDLFQHRRIFFIFHRDENVQRIEIAESVKPAGVIFGGVQQRYPGGGAAHKGLFDRRCV